MVVGWIDMRMVDGKISLLSMYVSIFVPMWVHVFTPLQLLWLPLFSTIVLWLGASLILEYELFLLCVLPVWLLDCITSFAVVVAYEVH